MASEARVKDARAGVGEERADTGLKRRRRKTAGTSSFNARDVSMMIRITVELISAIDPSRNRVLGVAKICNNWERSRDTNGARGTYSVWISRRAPHEKRTWKTCVVEDFPRKRLGVWDIIYRALREIVGERNPP